MPELPDVEGFRRIFERHAVGRTVRRVVVVDPGVLRNVSARTLDRALRGRTFEDPVRHGKWLTCWTDGPALLLHFGMTGALAWFPDDADRHMHDRVIFVLDRGEIRYRDLRKLQGLWLAHDEAEVRAVLGPLGPDALALDRSGFRDALSRRRGAVKAALLDQTVLAGVGNLLADEALWRARIHPAARVDRLGQDDVDRLHRALRSILRTSVRHDRVPGLRGWLTGVRAPGARCPRCGAALDRTVVGGRSTYACPRCQPPP